MEVSNENHNERNQQTFFRKPDSGCGGGGDFNEGLSTAIEAIGKGEVELITMEELKARGEDGIVVTISGVGSPASEEAYYSTDVYPVIVDSLREKVEQKIIGFIACEIGASSTFEPFIPAGTSRCSCYRRTLRRQSSSFRRYGRFRS